jgi:hypothetical protein
VSARAIFLFAVSVVLGGCPVAVTDAYTLEPESQGGAGTVACDDGRANGEETDVDCGGPACDPCGAGAACLEAGDCSGEVCTDSICE